MKIKATQLCRCGHKAAAHTKDVYIVCDDTESANYEEVVANSIGYKRHFRSTNCNCDKFELPNLDLIEYLAEQRGLI